jgi:Glucanosyltransferase
MILVAEQLLVPLFRSARHYSKTSLNKNTMTKSNLIVTEEETAAMNDAGGTTSGVLSSKGNSIILAGGDGDDKESRDSSSMLTTTTTSHASALRHRIPIGINDTISVQGRYLVYDSDPSRRFSVQGMAFPITPSAKSVYDESGWMAVLDQIAETTDVNTVRVYSMNCSAAAVHENRYQGFLEHAASLGIYVMVPLTSATGPGVLERTSKAPKCYTPHLYQHGTRCLSMFLQHPNVLAGLVGNEVMNSVKTWTSAPCIKAYAADLKRYMHTINKNNTNNTSATAIAARILPLAYAAQHDSITAQITPDESMKLTLDYLTCRPDDDDDVGRQQQDDNGIDVFGINVESWCSSLQTFHYNEDGITETAYYRLWQKLRNASVALMFTEMGCSKMLFDRDNGLQLNKSAPVRDWRQVPIVLHAMVDVFSGFCAYTYSGNPLFDMMSGGVWNGHNVLTPSRDYNNFAHELQVAQRFTPPPLVIPNDNNSSTFQQQQRMSCHEAIQNLQAACPDCTFVPFLKQPMPSYFNKNRLQAFFVQMSANYGVTWEVALCFMGVVLTLFVILLGRKCCSSAAARRVAKKKHDDYQQISSLCGSHDDDEDDGGKLSPQSYGTYQSISMDSAENGNYNNGNTTNGHNNGKNNGKVHAHV